MTARRVTGCDEELITTGKDPEGNEYKVATPSFNIVISKTPPQAMRNLVENLPPSLVTKIIAEPHCELKPIYQILHSVAKYWKDGIIKHALYCAIAYQLATSQVLSDGTDSIFESRGGRADSETP